jgi:hypothetical protein
MDKDAVHLVDVMYPNHHRVDSLCMDADGNDS